MEEGTTSKDRRIEARDSVLRSVARILMLIGKGVRNPLIRSMLGARLCDDIDEELEIIRVYQQDL